MNPIMMDFPNEIETERLYIRLPMPGDGKAAYEAVSAMTAPALTVSCETRIFL